jgi:predicted phosphodiesterase
MSKILVISDNHGEIDLMMQVIQKERANLIVHAGDHGIPLEFMKANFNYFVGGNNDYDGEEIQNFVYDGFKFMLVHGHQR